MKDKFLKMLRAKEAKKAELQTRSRTTEDIKELRSINDELTALNAEIEELRGVSAEVMLRKLLARNLIREAGRLEVAGRPFTYEVTEQFMDTFKLKSLDELPELPEYQQVNETERELFE